VHALVQRTCKPTVGHEDVEVLDAGHPRKKIPIRGEQSMSIHRSIGNGDDYMAIRPIRWLVENVSAQRMLVGARGVRTALEFKEDGSEKPRLLNELPGAAIVLSTGFQHAQRQAFEGLDVFLPALQVVVKAQHLRNETRTNAKRCVDAAVDHRSARDVQQHLTLFVGEPATRAGQPIGESANHLAGRTEIRKDDGVIGCGVFDAPHQVFTGGSSWNDDEAATGVERRPPGSK
jgi:hypothetical protein